MAQRTVFSIDSVSAEPEESFAVEVYLDTNTFPFSAANFPIDYGSSNLIFDSASFDKTILPAEVTATAFDFVDQQVVLINYVPPSINPLPTVDTVGLIATLYFQVSISATPGFVPFLASGADTEHFPPLWQGWSLSDESGGHLEPACYPGGVLVMTPTDVVDDESQPLIPLHPQVLANYPNPFNPTTTVEYSIGAPGMVRVEIVNVRGRVVQVLIDAYHRAGEHTVTFDASGLASGVYYCRVTNDYGTDSHALVLLK